ncbi:MAG: class I SAM-dependent methyltransferase [Candidatus Eisenbacteria bacterium]|jgi:ubiquinone/menaquinone biosynthesis C-methylase UbiE|nr:class I SAM-dependent methyltransferase [Candidatus Eisenbacteria bacterium]
MERVRFFDDLADRWDDVCDIKRVAASIRAGLAGMGIRPSECIVDIGCGTGTLLRCLLDVLGPEGRVHAVDISPRMIERARAKIVDPRVSFTVTSADRLPVPDASVDRVFCFSCWPHIDQPEPVLAEFARVLRAGGTVSIWHADGKEIINGIHQNAGEAVASDVLEPGEELAGLLRDRGFDVREVIDVPSEYRVSATRGAGRKP